MMEVTADTLVAEVARFNGFVDNKLDEDFNRPMEKAVKD